MNIAKEIIANLRRYEGIYISRKLEKYILEEFEEDLFPYGFSDDVAAYRDIKNLVARANTGQFNLNASVEERLMERYCDLKDAYLDLLCESNHAMLAHFNDPADDEPF